MACAIILKDLYFPARTIKHYCARHSLSKPLLFMVHILSNIFGSSKTKLCLYKTDNMDIGKSTICKAIGASFSTKAMHFIRFNWVTVECSKMLQWQSTSISTLVIWYRRVVRLIPIRYSPVCCIHIISLVPESKLKYFLAWAEFHRATVYFV